MSFSKEYKRYIKHCYDGEIHEIQTKEVKQAFYSGASLALNLLIGCLELNPDEIIRGPRN